MRIAFAVDDLGRGGGQMMIVKQSNGLAKSGRHEVFIVAAARTRSSLVDDLHANVRLVQRERAGTLPTMDLALATWWATGLWTTEIPAKSYGQYMQSWEDRFTSEHDRVARAWANAIQTLGWPTVTEASWIKEWLSFLAPQQPTFLARNGIDKNVFYPGSDRPFEPARPLRVVVEGPAAAFKGTRTALEGVVRAEVPTELVYVSARGDWADRGLHINRHTAGYQRRENLTQDQMAALLRQADVLIKMSTVEGMPGPPLEAMHCGATVIASPVKGIEEYAVHGYNSAIVPFHDSVAIGRWLDRFGDRPEILHRMKQGALETARNWPSDSVSAQEFEIAALAAADTQFVPSSIPDEPSEQSVPGQWTGSAGSSYERRWTKLKSRISKAKRIRDEKGTKELFLEVRRWRERQ